MIDFLKYRWVSGIASLAILMSAAGVFLHRTMTTGQAFNYSVDFTGGSQVLFKFDHPVSGLQIKEIIEKKGWENPVIREFSENEVMVRVKEFSSDPAGLAGQMKQAFDETLPDNPSTILQNESVGPAVGSTLRWKSIMAMLVATIAMMLYIAIRTWSYSFAVGAVVALVHDALIVLSIFLLLNREISLNVIGAILAVLGYSINDTIVIFSQIRSNMKKLYGKSLYDIVNISLNETLRRTLLTSISTLLTVGSLFLLGGEVLRDLSLVLLIGIVFGTYSSIFIASPVMMMLYKPKKQS